VLLDERSSIPATLMPSRAAFSLRERLAERAGDRPVGPLAARLVRLLVRRLGRLLGCLLVCLLVRLLAPAPPPLAITPLPPPRPQRELAAARAGAEGHHRARRLLQPLARAPGAPGALGAQRRCTPGEPLGAARARLAAAQVRLQETVDLGAPGCARAPAPSRH